MKTLLSLSFAKRTQFFLYLSFIVLVLFSACQKDEVVTSKSSSYPTPQYVIIGGTSYDIVLLGGAPVDNGNGTWTWTWTITNTNPGNGNNGTTQNLSHWDFIPGPCLMIGDIVSAGYSANGITYTNFSPSFAVDPSLNTCSPNPYSGEVLKFDFGTAGSAPSYYRLTLNQDYAVDPASTLIYKSGANTGCGTSTFEGIGCSAPLDCYAGETGWGAGTRFVKKGNWATYFSMTATAGIPTSKTVDLLAGQTMNAGTVTVSHDGFGNYTATYNTDSPWVISELHFNYYGSSVPPAQNPAPGQFPYKYEYNAPYADTHTFNFTGATSGTVYLAAHAVVLQPTACP